MTQILNQRKISIAGDLGSGKSLIGKMLAEKTGFKFYSTGGIQRKIASRHGITTLELNKRSETTREYDDEIDTFTRKLSMSDKSFFIDSRMAWYFIPNSFKIYLQVNIDIAAERIFRDKYRKNEKYPTFESAKKDIIHRRKSEHYRFLKYYKVDCKDVNNYDLVIDTSFSTPEEIVNLILKILSPDTPPTYNYKYWFPPQILKPTIDPKALKEKSIQKLVKEMNSKGFDYRYPIETVRNKDSLYILDGHLRVCAALFNKISLIPAVLTAVDGEEIKPGVSVREYIKNKIKSSWLKVWKEYYHPQKK